MNQELQNKFKEKEIEKNYAEAFGHFLESKFIEQDLKEIENSIKELSTLLENDKKLIQEKQKELADHRATGNIKYEVRKGLEAEIDQIKLNTEKTIETIQKDFLPSLRSGQKRIADHIALGQRNIRLAKFLKEFTVTEEQTKTTSLIEKIKNQLKK